MNAPAHRPALPPHAAVPARQGHHDLPQALRRRRARRDGAGARDARGRARGAARARGSGVHRHQSSAAARASRAAPRASSTTRRRPRTTSSSPTTSSRTPTSPPAACCRCARTPAPPSSWARRAALIWTDGDDEAALAEGARDAYLKRNLRYSQLAPISMFEEKNTHSNMPAQIEIYAEGRGRLQVPVHRQGRRLGQQELPVPGDALDPHARPHDGVPQGEDPHARHRGLPALSPRDRDRRHLGRADDEDGEARLDPLSRRPADAGLARTATPSATSRWSRRCTS